MKLFFVILSIFSLPSFAFDPVRPYLKRLEKKEISRNDDYENPYLHVVTAGVIPVERSVLLGRFRNYLGGTRVEVKSHFGKQGFPAKELSPANFVLPEKTITGKQLEGINDCTTKKCMMKLQDGAEKLKMEKSKNKLSTYQELVVQRVQRFLEKGELRAYEDRAFNDGAIKSMLRSTKFFPTRYPKTASFFLDGFWQKKAETPVLDSIVRKELLEIAPDRMQPILRISETFEMTEAETNLFVEFHLYTNHYFDGSLRIYEILASPWDAKKSIIVLTDVMEIDELKKSAIIRALYTGKMVEAVTQFQEKELDLLSVSIPESTPTSSASPTPSPS